MSATRTLVSALLGRAEGQPDQVAFTFGEGAHRRSVTMSELLCEAGSVAGRLREVASPGDRILLVLPPGVEYITSFYGCLLAGVVAVPVYPPTGSRVEAALERIVGIAVDCGASAVLTTSDFAMARDAIVPFAPQLAHVVWLTTDERGEPWPVAAADPADIAFLQYSSGSTGAPRGVVLRHRNVAHNLDVIGDCFGLREDDSAVIWLPPYHDMGLIGGVLAPIWHGFPVHLMSPSDVPHIWPAISGDLPALGVAAGGDGE